MRRCRKRRSGFGAGELERALISRASLGLAAEAPQEVGARGVQVLVVLQIEPLQRLQTGIHALGLRAGDRPVELDHGRSRERQQLAIQRGDL